MPDSLNQEVSEAVAYYWSKLSDQRERQRDSELATRGRRAEVLGGKQMDGFASLCEDLLVDAGLPQDSVLHEHDATLPGYYRATKRWDMAVVHDDTLLAVIEFKSITSSFGNNLNNRSEEAIGSPTDLYTAYEEGAYDTSPRSWLGYLMLMADNEASRNVPRLREVNFDVDDEFEDATYVDRMELLCLRMVRQRRVNESAFLLSSRTRGLDGEYWEPNEELQVERFVRSLASYVRGHADLR